MNFTASQWKQQIAAGALDEAFARLYGRDSSVIDAQRARYIDALDGFIATFGDCSEVHIFSAPGRTEIGGNHTDHNQGKVLAASVNLDAVGIATKADDRFVQVQSKGYPMDEIDLNDTAPRPEEREHSASLLRGVCHRLKELGLPLGGYRAYTVSSVLKGSGLSSSAAFEVLLGAIANGLYGGNRLNAVALAQTGQFAENRYFGKASGLLDQMTSAQGGFIAVDFADPQKPVIHPVSFDLADHGYALCIVDTKGSHADLSDEYSAIPNEMKQVAACFGKEVLRQVEEEEFYGRLAEVRSRTSDRATLRAMHFFAENHRVEQETAALEHGDMEAFLQGILSSGRSSACFLQNVFASSAPMEQGVTLGLALASRLLEGKGAWRVHGGGFAGTIQAFVPLAETEHFRTEMEKLFGADSVYLLNIRPVGFCQLG